MAVDIKVYGWRKPTLEIELVNGGSLAANTKYYIVGAYGFTPYTYCSISGPASDIYEITTTSTAKSIKIIQKTYRDIQSFSDNGDGRTRVECERHCFGPSGNDEVKISAGTYTGTYGVIWVDYNYFIIDTPYVDNTPTECYSDTYQYNLPSYNSGRNNASGMVYFISPTHPNPTGKYWSRSGYWTKRPWYTTNLENPLTITAQPSDIWGTYSSSPDFSNMNNGSAKICSDYGNVLVDWVGGTGYLDDIYDAVMEAGFTYNCGYNATGNAGKPTFELVGTLRGINDAAFNVTGGAITLWGEFNHGSSNTLFEFRSCNILFPLSFFTAYMNFTANDCCLFNSATSNTFANWIYGERTLQYISPRTGFDYAEDYYDNFTESTISAGVVDNKIFKDVGSAMYYQFAYNSRLIRNSTTFPLYWVMRADGAQPESTYMIDNVIIKETPSYDWGIRWYTYDPDTVYYIIDSRNVDEYDRYGNKRDRVRCVHNSPISGEFRFWRTVSFIVQSEGEYIENVNIKIENSYGIIYTGTTDSSGYFSTDIEEQLTQYEASQGTLGNWVDTYDTMYTGITTTFAKEGYDTERMCFDVASEIGTLNVGLVQTGDPIYIDRDIIGSIDSQNLSGALESNQINGDMDTINVIGSIETVTLSGSVEVDI